MKEWFLDFIGDMIELAFWLFIIFAFLGISFLFVAGACRAFGV